MGFLTNLLSLISGHKQESLGDVLSIFNRKGFIDVDVQYYDIFDRDKINKTQEIRLEVEEIERLVANGIQMSRIKVIDVFSHVDMRYSEKQKIMASYPKLIESIEINWLEKPGKVEEK